MLDSVSVPPPLLVIPPLPEITPDRVSVVALATLMVALPESAIEPESAAEASASIVLALLMVMLFDELKFEPAAISRVPPARVTLPEPRLASALTESARR